MKTRFAVLGIFGLVGVALSQENYSTWSKYRPVTINTTSSGANVVGSVGNFPVLVRLTSVQSDVFAQDLSGGADIRFTDSTGTTRLPHQRERWDSAGQVAEFWVLVPSIPGNANTGIRMYWGKAGAADSSNGAVVFDTANGFRSVWHLGDAQGILARPNAVAGAPAATPTSFPGDYGPKVGVIGLADSLRGGAAASREYLNIGAYDGFTNFTGGFTYSAWVYTAAIFKDAAFWNTDNGGNDRIIVGLSGTGTGEKFRFNIGTAGNIGINGGANKVVVNQWRHYVCTKDPASGPMRTYINGVLDSTVTGLADFPNVSRANNYLGRSYNAPADSNFGGILDETEISGVSRSADWAKLSYETQKSGSTAVALGASVSPVVGSPSITSNPVNKTVVAGSTVKFGVVASGNATLVYKWVRRNTDTVGTNSDSLTLTNVSNADTGSYKCVVRNSLGQAVSSSATLALIIAPTITSQPVNRLSVNAGNSTKCGVRATGTLPLIYQWIRRRNSVVDTLTNTGVFTGTTTDTLTVTQALISDSGSVFKCRVSNAAGVVVSDSALLTVREVLAVLPGKGISTFAIQNMNSSVKFHLPDGMTAARISVMDIWGRMVWSKTAGAGVTDVTWDGSHSGPVAAPGVYLVRLTVTDANHQSKLAAESKILITP